MKVQTYNVFGILQVFLGFFLRLLGIGIKWDFLGLNGIDFFGFLGILENPKNLKNQSHLIPKNPI